MQSVTTLSGTAAVIRRANIDTDQIIPVTWLKRVVRTGYEPGLFQIWRRDPDFVLNRPEYASASILIAGPNFGCGSSREHAVWALRDGGFRAIISSLIADIHRTNLPAEGLVPVQLDERIVIRLMDAVEVNPQLGITVDVEHRTLSCPAAHIDGVPFFLDDASHYALVHGLDPIGLSLEHHDLITAHEKARIVAEPWLPVGNSQPPS